MAANGLDNAKLIAQQLSQLGRNGDTQLAHVNPAEMALLKALGGSGTINPNTGLREFWEPTGGRGSKGNRGGGALGADSSSDSGKGGDGGGRTAADRNRANVRAKAATASQQATNQDMADDNQSIAESMAAQRAANPSISQDAAYQEALDDLGFDAADIGEFLGFDITRERDPITGDIEGTATGFSGGLGLALGGMLLGLPPALGLLATSGFKAADKAGAFGNTDSTSSSSSGGTTSSSKGKASGGGYKASSPSEDAGNDVPDNNGDESGLSAAAKRTRNQGTASLKGAPARTPAQEEAAAQISQAGADPLMNALLALVRTGPAALNQSQLTGIINTGDEGTV